MTKKIYRHGGDFFRYGEVIDFSANLNPLGMPDSVKKAVINSVGLWEKYPDPFCTELVGKISEREKINPENIVCGNGADDLIFRIVHALRPKKALIAVPCFSEYEKALSESRGTVTEYFLSEENNFDYSHDFADMAGGHDMVFICNPNNPTGRVINPEISGYIAEKCENKKTILVCDESFIDFVEGAEKFSVKNFFGKSVIIIKSFTKIFAMAGLRLGYAIFGDSEIAEKVRNTGQYWSVSTPAQIAGLTALNEEKYISETVEYVSRERDFLESELDILGVDYIKSHANFILFRSFPNLQKKMLGKNILIRDCGDYHGLGENFYRTAVRTHDENKILTKALREIYNNG